MDKALGLGVIGTGRIGRAHLQAAAALAPQVKLAAVTNRTPEKAQAAREITAVDTVHPDIPSLLRDEAVDAVVLCLPYKQHHDVALQAIAAGKHVLVEKPMAANADEAAAMVDAARAAGLTLMVGQSRRFSDAAMEAHRRRGEIGSIFRIVTNFMVQFDAPPTEWWADPAQSGSLIIPLQGSHYVDFALWFKQSQDQPAIASQVFARHRSHNPIFGAPDEGDIHLEMNDGTVVSIHLSLSAKPPVHETVMIGTAGTLRLEEYPTGVPFGVGNRLWINGELIREGEQSPSIYTRQLAEFAAALRENRAPVASGNEVLATMDVLQACSEAHMKECLVAVRRR